MKKRSSKPHPIIVAAIITGIFGCAIAIIGILPPIFQKLVDTNPQVVAPRVPTIGTLDPTTEIQKVAFDYLDSPTNHGWKIVSGETDESELDIKHISDQFVGSAISISSSVKYGLDFDVGTAASQFGRIIEFVGAFGNGADIYAFVGLEQDDGSTTTGWLKFEVGGGPPKPVYTGTGTGEDEWLLLIEPIARKGGEWLLLQVDLEDAVRRTFGSDGWKFRQLEKFRIRGNLSLDYISVYERP